MLFKDVIGQSSIKKRLIQEVQEGRVPHAQLFTGPEGVGKLPMAIAYARYLLCKDRREEDSCGECQSCRMFNNLSHPDLHFVFPVINKAKAPKKTVSDDLISIWRSFLLENPYFTINHWLEKLDAENQQATIYTAESEEISKKLSLKSSQGGFKVMIIWL